MMYFFFNDTATTEIYTLSLHDALPIYITAGHLARAEPGPCGRFRCHPVGAVDTPAVAAEVPADQVPAPGPADQVVRDRKSTRLNSSHANISYAVFCLKKKKHVFTHAPA